MINLPAETRVLVNLPGADHLVCACGSTPDMYTPDPRADDVILGVCECGAWTIYQCVGGDWSAVVEYRLGIVPELLVEAAADLVDVHPTTVECVAGDEATAPQEQVAACA